MLIKYGLLSSKCTINFLQLEFFLSNFAPSVSEIRPLVMKIALLGAIPALSKHPDIIKI